VLVKCNFYVSGEEEAIERSLHFLPSKGDLVKLDNKEYLVQSVVYDLPEGGEFVTDIYIQGV
jgi:hypothetical protein